MVPVTTLGSARSVYKWTNTCLAEGLASLGIPAEIAPEPPGPTPLDTGPCFQVAAGGEVTAGGRKLVGSAQVKMRNILLQHGSILVADDQGLLAGLG
ncbi:MAG TPA: lipoate--protein ligase family protein, partial [Gemmatimonadetes bacterium]|nr:lipoate--protein ligase family protein [Gemmatimonadota bacterium]